jgi:hypothetical protein
VGQSERPTEFETLANNTKADFAAAMERGCSDDGHKSMGTAGVRTVEMLVIMHQDMKNGFAEMLQIPDSTVAKLRNEVVTLVDSHAEDAVKKHLAMRVPAGQSGIVSREGPVNPLEGVSSGPWAAVLATIGRVPMAATICAVTGFLTFSVYVLAKGLKIL